MPPVYGRLMGFRDGGGPQALLCCCAAAAVHAPAWHLLQCYHSTKVSEHALLNPRS